VSETASVVKPLIECRHISHGYQRGKETLTVIDDLSLQVSPGEFVALMGPSGSGKSTLLNLVGGLDQPRHGQVVVEGIDLSALSPSTLTDWRATNVGFVFQFYNLIPVLNAADNVELPLMLTSLSTKERRARVATALEIVGLADRAKHKPTEMSGGQQQRVAIARAIVSDPRMLVCDEPTGDLDRDSADAILGLLTLLNRDHGKTILMVTHDPKAAAHASRTWVMDKGRLVTAGERS